MHVLSVSVTYYWMVAFHACEHVVYYRASGNVSGLVTLERDGATAIRTRYRAYQWFPLSRAQLIDGRWSVRDASPTLRFQ